MAKLRRILTVLGTRPEAIKLFPLIHAFATAEGLHSRVCVSAQHRTMLDQVLAVAGIVPDHDLDLMRPGQALDGLTAVVLEGVGRVLEQEAPDWVVVQGDTTTALAAALAAHYRKIPVCHVEAGLRSGDIYHPWPEEANRRMIGSFATLHCAPTIAAAEALRAENIQSANIHVTGNTVVDALHWVMRRIEAEPGLVGGLAALERRFAGKRLIAVTSHRRENQGAGMQAIASAVRRIASRGDVAVILPLHPNPIVRDAMRASLSGLENVALTEPLDYPHFARLLRISCLVLTDSGGVQEEAPALGKPVLIMRETTERPEGVAAGTARLVGSDADRIVSAVETLLDDPAAYAAMAQAHNPYGDGKAAERIAGLLTGWTGQPLSRVA